MGLAGEPTVGTPKHVGQRLCACPTLPTAAGLRYFWCCSGRCDSAVRSAPAEKLRELVEQSRARSAVYDITNQAHVGEHDRAVAQKAPPLLGVSGDGVGGVAVGRSAGHHRVGTD